MDLKDLAILVSAILTPLGTAFGLWLTYKLQVAKLKEVQGDVHKIEIATNSMKDDLVRATADAAFGAGDKQGRKDLKSEIAADSAK